MVQKIRKAFSKRIKNVRQKMAPKPLIWRGQKRPILGRTYVFSEGIEIKSTPKKSPRDTYILRKFKQGKLDSTHNKFFAFVGKETGTGLKCIFYISRNSQ